MHVVATAGHVDHGKSTLVRALTGMEPDRFAEERRRGLTIDLGYAWTALPSGVELAFVDVPGHQRFIANMLAGVGPAPAVLFVVAADAGWRQQSGEHLAAIDALDLRHGLLAVTRSDLADPAPAVTEARDHIAASSLGDVPAVTVSGATGRGLDELRTALDRLVARLPVPDGSAPVRLWLDRSFSVRGAGTVVTGTLAAGTITVGDQLELRGRPVTVRGLQTLGGARERVTAAARVAVNLRAVAHDDAARGDQLLAPGAWPATSSVDVRLARPGRLPRELVLHVGTAAVPVRVRALDDRYARLTLATPLPLATGDRAVLRDPGRQIVATGVSVLDIDPPPLARRGAAARRAGELAEGVTRVPPPAAAPPPAPARNTDALDALLARLAADPFAAPERDELAALGVGPRALASAARNGRLLRLTPDVVVAADAPQRALEILTDVEQPFTASAARQALGVTRRVAIPLLEHLDGLGRTVRVDADRRLVTVVT